MSEIIDIIGHVRKLKSAHKLSLNTPLDTLTIATNNADLPPLILSQEKLIKGVTHAKELRCSFSTAITETVLDNNGALTATIMHDHTAHKLS